MVHNSLFLCFGLVIIYIPAPAQSTAQKIKFSINDLVGKCNQVHSSQETADLVTFTEDIFNRKRNFLRSEFCKKPSTHFMLRSLSIPPENTRKPLIF